MTFCTSQHMLLTNSLCCSLPTCAAGNTPTSHEVAQPGSPTLQAPQRCRHLARHVRLPLPQPLQPLQRHPQLLGEPGDGGNSRLLITLTGLGGSPPAVCPTAPVLPAAACAG
eukprot:CAMPEP_0202860628 /NCGR_PEP_ID=MMETSP1391-20130828/2277_1 /ASSEMBLY_ACC=CAM_ASM_000867 /TAXON_ID=1034604 /ORGANISM="Chlamydomonas leiostraca, Strain SAG 11-49" /LENGTH=111 /DNA_ID=CAMNT_0049539839 /DNA_START=507 /DNA_END=839 /DNA_ORIENTATION=+